MTDYKRIGTSKTGTPIYQYGNGKKIATSNPERYINYVRTGNKQTILKPKEKSTTFIKRKETTPFKNEEKYKGVQFSTSNVTDPASKNLIVSFNKQLLNQEVTKSQIARKQLELNQRLNRIAQDRQRIAMQFGGLYNNNLSKQVAILEQSGFKVDSKTKKEAKRQAFQKIRDKNKLPPSKLDETPTAQKIIDYKKNSVKPSNVLLDRSKNTSFITKIGKISKQEAEYYKNKGYSQKEFLNIKKIEGIQKRIDVRRIKAAELQAKVDKALRLKKTNAEDLAQMGIKVSKGRVYFSKLLSGGRGMISAIPTLPYKLLDLGEQLRVGKIAITGFSKGSNIKKEIGKEFLRAGKEGVKGAISSFDIRKPENIIPTLFVLVSTGYAAKAKVNAAKLSKAEKTSVLNKVKNSTYKGTKFSELKSDVSKINALKTILKKPITINKVKYSSIKKFLQIKGKKGVVRSIKRIKQQRGSKVERRKASFGVISRAGKSKTPKIRAFQEQIQKGNKIQTRNIISKKTPKGKLEIRQTSKGKLEFVSEFRPSRVAQQKLVRRLGIKDGQVKNIDVYFKQVKGSIKNARKLYQRPASQVKIPSKSIEQAVRASGDKGLVIIEQFKNKTNVYSSKGLSRLPSTKNLNKQQLLSKIKKTVKTKTKITSKPIYEEPIKMTGGFRKGIKEKLFAKLKQQQILREKELLNIKKQANKLIKKNKLKPKVKKVIKEYTNKIETKQLKNIDLGKSNKGFSILNKNKEKAQIILVAEQKFIVKGKPQIKQSAIVKNISLVKPKSSSLTKIYSLVKSFTMSNLKLALPSILKLGNYVKVDSLPKIISKFNVDSLTKIKSLIKSDVVTSIKSRLKIKTPKIKTPKIKTPKIKTPTPPKIKTPTPPKIKTPTPPKIKTPKIKKTVKTKTKIKIPKLKKKKTNKKGYIIKIRRQKKFFNVPNIILNKKEASNLGKWIVDNSTAATFKISKSKRNINREVSKISKTGTKFRKSKTKALKNSLIEKRKYRINTQGETQGLAASRLIKRLK